MGLTTRCSRIPTSKSSKSVAICPRSNHILEAVRCSMKAGSAISHCNIYNIQENWGLSTQLVSWLHMENMWVWLSKPLHSFKILVASHLQLNITKLTKPFQQFQTSVHPWDSPTLSDFNCEPCSAWTRSACSFRSV